MHSRDKEGLTKTSSGVALVVVNSRTSVTSIDSGEGLKNSKECEKLARI
jgi:hypothetical protein